MSAGNQNNKKSGSSSNSSMVNTPANTPVSNMANGQNTTQNSPPPNNAPKFGTLVPNRIFVGGISANTTESELLQLFSNYGTVKAAKIIQDRAGVSKGYGFITFESEDDAKKLQREADNIVLRERKLNIAPAIKKQPFSRGFDASSPPAVGPGNPTPFYFPPGAMPYFQGGVAYYPQPPTGPADPTVQQPPVYQPPSVYSQQTAAPQPAAYPPVMFPTQHLYMPQQYPLPMPYEYSYYTNGGPPQYMVGGQGGSQPQIPPLQRPNSPPRPNCFGQLQYTNSDPMYYNMPIYGPLDGTVYPDPVLEIHHNAMPEGVYYIQDATPPSGETQLTTVNHNNMQTKIMDSSHIDVNGRQASTPVVSLLSLDQQQDRDLLSMQSGRREKSTNSSNYSHYSYNNNCSSQNYNGIPMDPSLQYGANNCYRYTNLAQLKNPKTNPNIVNGYNRNINNNNTRKWQNNERRSVETSSISSLRTDSNSSASIVDENKNEEIVLTNNNNKTSYNNNYETHNSVPNFQKVYGTRNIVSATVRPTRGAGFEKRNYSNPRYSHSQNSVNPNNRNYDFGRHKEANRCFQNVPNTYNKPPISPIYQMHANQHFMPPSRNRNHHHHNNNNRRNMRRNGPSAVNEIGAGDAPLPNAEVPEICNKFETLKLA